MIAVLGGLGAAVCWAVGTISAARASRAAGAWPVLAWVMIVGLVVTAPLTGLSGAPDGLDGREIGWMALSGAGNVAGLLLVYEAMRVGKVSVTAPITSTEGAVAALFAVVAGESLRVSSAVLLGLMALGVVLASLAGGAEGAHAPRATVLSAGAALAFGASLFATGRVSQALPIAWAILPPRVVAVVAIVLPLLFAGARRLRLPIAVLPFAALSGLCEVGGFASYAIGARHAIAISAVLASQFAALTAIAAFLLFRERLRPVQLVGIATIGVCVGVLSGLRA